MPNIIAELQKLADDIQAKVTHLIPYQYEMQTELMTVRYRLLEIIAENTDKTTRDTGPLIFEATVQSFNMLTSASSPEFSGLSDTMDTAFRNAQLGFFGWAFEVGKLMPDDVT